MASHTTTLNAPRRRNSHSSPPSFSSRLALKAIRAATKADVAAKKASEARARMDRLIQLLGPEGEKIREWHATWFYNRKRPMSTAERKEMDALYTMALKFDRQWNTTERDLSKAKRAAAFARWKANTLAAFSRFFNGRA